MADDDEPQLKEYIERDAALSKVVLFVIVANHSSIERRYTEFAELHADLVNIFPGKMVTIAGDDFPKKTAMKTAKVSEERMAFFQKFIKALHADQELRESKYVRLFLHPDYDKYVSLTKKKGLDQDQQEEIDALLNAKKKNKRERYKGYLNVHEISHIPGSSLLVKQRYFLLSGASLCMSILKGEVTDQAWHMRHTDVVTDLPDDVVKSYFPSVEHLFSLIVEDGNGSKTLYLSTNTQTDYDNWIKILKLTAEEVAPVKAVSATFTADEINRYKTLRSANKKASASVRGNGGVKKSEKAEQVKSAKSTENLVTSDAAY